MMRAAIAEVALTRFRERMRAEAIRTLPVLPRALFSVHNFYDVDADTIAGALWTDSQTIAACLAEARMLIHGYSPYALADRFDPVGAGASIARLERQLRQDYRQSITESFARCGYGGVINWPEADTDIEADEDAAAAFIITFLHCGLRNAVTRARRPRVAIVDLWRVAPPWQRRRRERLLSVADAVHCSGWRAYEIWLADRIAPDLHYPHGYPDYQRQRRPLPGEAAALPDDDGLATAVERTTSRLAGFDPLTQQASILFHQYGRGGAEIAQRLCIGRGSVKRRIHRANYAIGGWPYPSLAWRVGFDLRCRWQRLRQQWRDIAEILRG